MNTQQINLYSLGGGSWIAEVDISTVEYAAVSLDCPDFLNIYKRTDDEPYLPEDMTASLHIDELPDNLKPLYTKLLNSLKPHM